MATTNTELAAEFTAASVAHEQCLRAMSAITATVTGAEKQRRLDLASARLVEAVRAICQAR